MIISGSKNEKHNYSLSEDEISINSKWVKVPAINIEEKRIVKVGRFYKTAMPKDQWFEDIEDPESLIKKIKKSRMKADIFMFWQKLPETAPKFNYFHELFSLATLVVEDYDHWWNNQINSKTRNMVRKAEKNKVTAQLVDFDDDFIMGVTEIFNETPVRQGYNFAHYGKTFDAIKSELSKDLEKKIFVGAYHEKRLIGFSILYNAGTFAVTNHFLCKIADRNKATANGLMAKIIEECINKGIPNVVYGVWHERSLGDFARRNGFKKIDLPKYYVPLTLKGRIVLKLGLHKGIVQLLPKRLKLFLVKLREIWYSKLCVFKKTT